MSEELIVGAESKAPVGAQRIAANTFFLTFSSLFNLGISLGTTSIIARSIGPELYGRYTFGLTYVLMFSVLANFGLESLFIREAARDRRNLELINDIFHLKVVLAFATVATALLSAQLLQYPAETIQVLYILCAGLFFQILSESLLSIYRSVERMQVTAFVSMFFRLISAAIIVVAIYSGIGFYGIVAAFSIGNFLVFLLALVKVRRDFNLLRWVFSPTHWLPLIRQGMPFYMSALLTMFYAKINVFILSKFVEDREMGLYLAALNLVENLYFIPTAFITSVFPAFSRMHGTSVDSLKDAYSRMTKYLIIATAAVAAGTILVSEKIVLLIYGNEFGETVPVLNVLIFLWVLAFFSNFQSSLLFSMHKERIQVQIMVAAVCVNALLNWFFIREYGHMGAAFASVLTEMVVVLLLSGVLWGLGFRYRPDMSILRLMLVVGGMVAVVKYLIGFHLVIAVLGGAASYAGLLVALRVFDRRDLADLKALFARKKLAVP
ncbi:MAG: flippase [Sterolibacteriaceae bacterium]|nr:flippase [Candidatus Methylophosphatis haderslevensis]